MSGKEHFGYNQEQAGEKAAKDVAEGKISPKDVGEKYQTAKDTGGGEKFKEGYAKGAQKTFDKNK